LDFRGIEIMAKSFCTSCKETFSSVASFDKHRVGDFGRPIYGEKRAIIGYTKPNRRCLTPEEMQAKGMQKNQHGYWITRSDSRSYWEPNQAEAK
jgi:hypothetical protein